MGLEAIDIYGKPYNFTIFKKDVFKTTIGGVFSILTFLCFLLSFIFFGEDFYKRQNPKYINQKISLEKYPIYNVSNQVLAAAFIIEDYNGNYFDHKRYFNMSIQYYRFDSNKPTGNFLPTIIPSKFINCTAVNIKHF